MTATNAVLTKITGAGAPDRYGDPGAGQVLWSGRAAGYLKRVRRSVLSMRLSVEGSGGGVQTDVRVDIFTILASASAPVVEVAGPDWEATTVEIEDQRTSPPVVRTFTVTAMENRAAGTIADSVRLELDQETAT